MLDIKYIRDNAEDIKTAAKQKNINVDIDNLLQLDSKRVELIKQVEELNRQRNENSKVSQGSKPTDEQIAKGRELKEQISKLEDQLKEVEKDYLEIMVLVPNIPSKDTPVGKDESENVEVERHGDIPKFDFEAKNHIELGESLDLLDLERGAKVAGYRGYYVKNEGVMLMLGLMMYGLKKLTEQGFTPMIPPTLVKEFALFGSGYFKGVEYNDSVDEIYKVASRDKEETGEETKDSKYLVGTAEPSLLAYYSGETLKEKDLPKKFVGFSQCYRSEIGSYGKDTKGIYRVHEFMKVEQVVLCKADIEESDKLQQQMVSYTKDIYKDLEIPFRVIQICTGDMSAGKYKMFDIETWSPSRNGWAEVGSASNFLDWQARRLNVKYETKDGKKEYVYMLNNTVIPTVRPFLTILENNQQKDGSVVVPKVLVPYVGKEVIKPK